MNETQKMNMCSIWLIKYLCIDTNAETATLAQEVTEKGVSVGKYEITIKKL